MGDKYKATNILNEVVLHGTSPQKKEAKRLLKKIIAQD